MISKKIKSLKKTLDSKLISRALIKRKGEILEISEVKAPNVLGDTNKFLKNEIEEVKKTMFFT